MQQILLEFNQTKQKIKNKKVNKKYNKPPNLLILSLIYKDNSEKVKIKKTTFHFLHQDQTSSFLFHF